MDIDVVSVENMFELRDYQQEATGKMLEFFESGKDSDVPVVVAPTGAGKSLYIGYVAKMLHTGVLVLQPSKELLEQNYAKYVAYGGRASIYSASVGIKEIGEVTFATIGSIKSKPEDFTHVKYVIIDECHLVPPSSGSMFMKFLSCLSGVKVIGLTATPFRLKKYNDPFTMKTYSQINMLMRERPKFFNKILYVTQISEMYEKGFLCPIKPIEMAWSNGDLRVNTTGAEYTEKSMDYSMKAQRVHERLPDIIRQSIEKGRKHRVVFVKNVADAIDLARKVPDSDCVHAGTKKKDREIMLKQFREGKIKTIFNVGVLTVGFDFPALDTVIVARPTMSLALYMQMVGRGLRLSEGKNDCAVVDMCGNMAKFGSIENIEYKLDLSGKWVVMNGEKLLSGVPLNKVNDIENGEYENPEEVSGIVDDY